MPYLVRTNVPLLQLPFRVDRQNKTETQRIETSGTEVLLTNAEYEAIPANVFSSGKLTDLGLMPESGDEVVDQAVVVAAPAALTSVVAAGAEPTKAEYDALRADVVALRTTVANLLVALKGTGKPMASS